MTIFIYIFLFTAILLILVGLGLGDLAQTKRIRTRLPQEEYSQAKGASVPAFTLPFLLRGLEKFKLDVKIRNKLEAARTRLSVAGYLNLKLFFIAFCGIVSFFVFSKFNPAAFLVAIVLGYLIPELWLNRKINQRRAQIKRFLPETVDLLGLCVEAGLDFNSALRWIIEKKIYNNTMIEELAFVLEEIKWGKPRAQALKDMAKRLKVQEVSSVVNLLVQAERMGTPVSEAFTVISEDTRLQRYREGERFAMKAPLKILIPLIFCILPVIGIIVGGPILLEFLQGNLLK